MSLMGAFRPTQSTSLSILAVLIGAESAHSQTIGPSSFGTCRPNLFQKLISPPSAPKPVSQPISSDVFERSAIPPTIKLSEQDLNAVFNLHPKTQHHLESLKKELWRALDLLPRDERRFAARFLQDLYKQALLIHYSTLTGIPVNRLSSAAIEPLHLQNSRGEAGPRSAAEFGVGAFVAQGIAMSLLSKQFPKLYAGQNMLTRMLEESLVVTGLAQIVHHLVVVPTLNRARHEGALPSSVADFDTNSMTMLENTKREISPEIIATTALISFAYRIVGIGTLRVLRPIWMTPGPKNFQSLGPLLASGGQEALKGIAPEALMVAAMFGTTAGFNHLLKQLPADPLYALKHQNDPESLMGPVPGVNVSGPKTLLDAFQGNPVALGLMVGVGRFIGAGLSSMVFSQPGISPLAFATHWGTFQMIKYMTAMGIEGFLRNQQPFAGKPLSPEARERLLSAVAPLIACESTPGHEESCLPPQHPAGKPRHRTEKKP